MQLKRCDRFLVLNGYSTPLANLKAFSIVISARGSGRCDKDRVVGHKARFQKW